VTPLDFPAQAQRYSQYKFCPCCGRAFDPSDFNAAACLFVCRACDFDFYQNPSPAAVAVITHPQRSDEVLLLKRRTAPHVGRWCVPGGFLAYGETPAAGARREALEEVGLEIEVVQLLHAGLVDYAYRGRQICVVEIGFLARLTDTQSPGSMTTDEASETTFLPVDAIIRDPSMLAFPEQLMLMQAFRRVLDAR
jgi:8-oxo-dGTP diphosphatase